MRVIYLHQYFNTPAMAGGTRSYEMARRLVAAGHDVHMVTTWREATDHTDWFQTREAGIDVHWLPVPYSNRMGFGERLRAFRHFAVASARKAASLPGDVVFATSTPLTIAIPGIAASRWKRVPLVFEVRDLWPDVPVAMGLLRNPVAVRAAYGLERLAYTMSSRVVVVAPGMKQTVAERGCAASRVAVIPNGCDFDLFESPADRSVSFPNAIPGAKAVLYLGAMGVANGVEYIPRLAHELRRRAGAGPVLVQFHLVGDGARRAATEALAKELGVDGSWVTFTSPMPKREIARWVQSADATIITYDGPEIVFRDSVSNKFFDSIAAGKPVIANYAGFATTTAAEAGAGFIIGKDPAAAAVELEQLLGDPAILRTAGERARCLAHERFDRDGLAAELERVLLDAVNGGAARNP